MIDQGRCQRPLNDRCKIVFDYLMSLPPGAVAAAPLADLLEH